MPHPGRISSLPLFALLVSHLAPLHAQEAAPRQVAPRPARAAQPAQAQAGDNGARMQWLLEKWELQSAKLKTLDVRIYRIDKDVQWKDEVHFEGRAVFKNPNLAYLDFKKIKLANGADGRPAPVKDPKTGRWVTTPTETIVCGKEAVWQYLYEGRQIFVFPLAKGERQRALDEGPLPFLFNMKAQDARRRYEMSLQRENADYYLVKILPKLQEDKESFKMALLYLEKQFLLPAEIALVSPDGKSSRDFRLYDIKSNQEVKDEIFRGGVPPRGGWKVVQNPAAEAPRQGNAAGRPAGAGRVLRR